MSGDEKSAPQPELSQRQSQILELLQAGKVNKEVARELGIGVGTVKQHIVALFKKLNVHNRALAVSRGMDRRHEQERRGSTLEARGLLERRPCVVLSVALPEDASQVAARLMYGTLAALASANDAVFLARQGNAGDVIFGIQRVTEYDVAIALQTARAVYDDLLALDAGWAEKIRGCLTAGLAVASMKRFGGWTGEAIASAVIASARELLNDMLPGQLAFDSAALNLIEAFGIGGQQKVPPALPFQELKNLHWTGSRRAYPLVGRDDELAILKVALNKAVNGKGRLIHVEGEMGMGKSRLCEEVLQHCLDLGGLTSFYRCLPAALGKSLYDAGRGTDCSVEDVASSLRAKPTRSPELNVVDDFHLLPKVQQALLSAAAAVAVENKKMVVFSGRRGVIGSGSHPAETINLRRLSAEAIETLVRGALDKGGAKARPREVRDISSTAAGVPLFAVELARHHDAERLALPLLVAVNARLDSLSLDRNLLLAVARSPAPPTVEKIAETLGEDAESLRLQVERSVAAGVLSRSADGCLSFTHPLLRRAIDSLVME
jgi:DNA-binding CsgD family transcriptional regulator